jgi:hypothetical protein
VSKQTHGDVTVLETLDPADPFSNYSEAQYGNRTARWIKKVVAAKQVLTRAPTSRAASAASAAAAACLSTTPELSIAWRQEPFFAFIGTSGPHLGVIPAPWHREMTANLKGPDGQVRLPPQQPQTNSPAPVLCVKLL